MLEGILRQQPEDGRCIFVDMNSFFASAEQQANPKLRGRPVAVCPFVSDKTVCLAASIEAKRYGVKTGTKVRDAKVLCPDIVLLQAHPKLYREYHRQIMAELDNTVGQVFVQSVDEAMILVPSYLRHRAADLGLEIKERMRKLGSELRCSVGIGSNYFVSKMGTNLHKPDGFVDIKTTDLEGIYALLDLTDLHGIAWRMARRLKALGIYTPLEFYRAPFGLLKRAFGVNGESWYLRLRGFEVDLKPTKRGMIGHQTTIVPKPAETKEQVLSTASQLTYRAATRLRHSGLAAKSVVVSVRFAGAGRYGWEGPSKTPGWWYRIYRGSQPFFDSATFFAHVNRLMSELVMSEPVRFVSVTAVDLVPRTNLSQQLFDDHDREERLSEALDEINFRYGEATIASGRNAVTKRIHDAIGFGNAAQNAIELPK